MRQGRMVVAVVLAIGTLITSVGLHLEDGRTVADGAFVNGHGPYRFLIDTGSNVSLMDAALARSIGLKSERKAELGSSAGSTTVPAVDDLQISVGDAKTNHQS